MTKKTVLITGATGGIGRAVAEKFVKDSKYFNVVLIDHPAKAKDLIDVIFALTPTNKRAVDSCCHDLALPYKETEGFLREVGGCVGSIDVLINVAGIAPQNMTPLVKTDLEAARKIMDVNFWGTANLCKAVLPIMQANGYGRIINVSSISAFMADPGNIIYSASKAAVVQLTRALAKEAPFNKNGAPHDITVNAVAPGVIDTDMARQLKEPMVDGFKKATPFGRLGRPEEVAYAVAMLASPRASWITGVCLPVDGAQGRSLI